MSSTQTITTNDLEQAVLPLDFNNLETVKWVSDSYYYQQGYKIAETKYDHYKSYTIGRWIFATIEIFLISALLFVQQIPWPDWVIRGIERIDKIIASSLEWATNKLDWWWDIFTVRMMRLRESLENVIDGILSFTLFCFLLASRIVVFFLQVLKLYFLPIAILKKLIWPEQNTSPQATSMENPTTNDDENINVIKETELGTGEQHGSSEYESDVSIIAEASNLSHSLKTGQPYNRFDTKVTAEGKLRAIMYKRVKAQLQVMRKHSIRFSKGMASYVKGVIAPTMKPTVNVITDFLYKIAQKYGLVSVFEEIQARISKYPLLHRTISILWSIVMIPFDLYDNVSSRRKSKRTRSVRSESLRRRMANANVITTNPLTSLVQSTEMIKEETPNPTAEPIENEFSRDSALASSIDGTTSDSNEGLNTLKNSTITEEMTRNEDMKLLSKGQNGKSYTNSWHKRKPASKKSGHKKERPKSMEGSLSEQEIYSLSPKLAKRNPYHTSLSKEDCKEVGHHTSPKHGRRFNHKNFKQESGKFLTPDYLPSSPEVFSEDLSSKYLWPDQNRLEKRRISFTL